MKRCPQCQSVFEDDNSFCLNDGAVLINAEAMPAPAFVVDLSPEVPTQVVPIPRVVAPQPPPVKNSQVNYVVPLLVGLLLGGALVLAVFVLMKDKEEKPSVVAADNVNAAKSETPKRTPKKVERNANAETDGENYNGRVIMINANLRSAPTTDAETLETLPLDELINIGRREHANSPWYRVTCEHGTEGWMHGNTIEYTQ